MKLTANLHICEEQVKPPRPNSTALAVCAGDGASALVSKENPPVNRLQASGTDNSSGKTSTNTTDLPTPPPLAPAQTGQRRSNLSRNPLNGQIVRNDKKHGFR